MVVFTKLMKFMVFVAVFLEAWYLTLSGWLPIDLSPRFYQAMLPLPLYAIMLLGCYSLGKLGIRLITFNDCNEAQRELQEDISNARKDLTARGFKF